MVSKKKFAVLAVTLMALVSINCKAQTPAAAPAAAPAPAPAVAPAAPAPAPVAAPAAAAPAAGGAGSITGKVTFTGTPPVMAPLKREADPFCGKTKMTDQEILVNANGTLKNVYVRISQGAQAAAAPVTPAIVDQSNCMYNPRVVAVMKGQKVLVRNSDPVLHNIHTYVGTATGFNQAMFKGMKDIEKTFDQVGVMKFKCDVHPWMTGWVAVSDNPFFAITGDDGSFTLANVPAGAYTVEAWHEKYGTKTVQVTVAAGQPATAAFAYAAQ